MALSQSQNFGRDLNPSFHGNTAMSSTGSLPFLDRSDPREENELNHISPHNCDSAYMRLGTRSKRNKLISALKEKIIGDRTSARSSRSEIEDLSSLSSHTISQFDEDEEDEAKTFRNEMYKNNCVIDSLKEKYVCLNVEFNQLQEHHGKYVESQNVVQTNDEEEASYSDSSENLLERKCTQIFHSREIPDDRPSKIRIPRKKRKGDNVEDKENIPVCQHNNKELKLILKTLRKIFKSPPKDARDTPELKKLYEIVKTLREEQEKFRNIIKEQQDQLNDFHIRYIQAQNIIQSQKCEINQLYLTNTQLENELNSNMTELRKKFQDKINEVAHLPRAVKAEKTKCDKLAKENCNLIARLQQIKQEVINAKSKLEETCQKRTKILSKLKSAERDLKIFRTQNSTLKAEKRTLYEELRKLRGVNDDLKSTSTKSISRQRERGETQQRLLRKKIIDLELELDRSRNSTNVLVEERDKLIAELHMQLNTLVHNFEVSQKHIRILRRHIYSLSNNQAPSENNFQ